MDLIFRVQAAGQVQAGDKLSTGQLFDHTDLISRVQAASQVRAGDKLSTGQLFDHTDLIFKSTSSHPAAGR